MSTEKHGKRRKILQPQITEEDKERKEEEVFSNSNPLSFSVLLSVDFLFFLYAFHAAISIRYWFAIDIAIRYRYRSYPACSIASSDSDSDSDSERTTTPVAARLR
uniref:Uncharacterized protein n=1 Tax=Candidatus Kentrum sp. FM TaxID=2126340 RepID=A0A450S3E1_9GAMM|nr:MAG: hypothetical protein BECKFM1743A_GA0114220_100334 [Candidatus Kentron sp. FM]